ncbi:MULTISPECIES: hypothetical protein [Vibrio]|jgi:hypothetical protein|uniref:NADH dehydrogenase n=1 Tax=Vibrio mediterranei TaxID=689 RepID=A0A2C9P9G4_9VIBR|nr:MULTISPECIES: hypothetical protein [Vibrio]ASI89459.1 hypothetical protein BSZ05_06385 [Vibrio mediterranei]AYV21425.1 hypothetical protein ECB94_09090 [Vibrio mediterranei]EDL51280.1 NADH dehydrogenase subunit II-related protein [Vibrio mediterranei AK1]MCF4176031.1 hypothetical protein [Vibrio sp. McD22-P3]MCG9627131.1 hypothetical protein [Vibrio mediterranei]
MLTRYTGMTAKSQSSLFTFGFVLTVLGMVLTDMWTPMVVGAIVMAGLSVESWIRVQHLIPMHNEIRAMQKQIKQLQSEVRTLEYDE